MGQWTRDHVPFPGTTFRQVIDLLFRRNAIVRHDLFLTGRRIDSSAITAPVLMVAAEKDYIVPGGGRNYNPPDPRLDDPAPLGPAHPIAITGMQERPRSNPAPGLPGRCLAPSPSAEAFPGQGWVCPGRCHPTDGKPQVQEKSSRVPCAIVRHGLTRPSTPAQSLCRPHAQESGML